jgi:flavin-dependent dehydrogenase
MVKEAESHYDVLIIGGGPAGSTVASLLRKYNPDLSVLILEKAKFPRDHVGESQLPSISPILKEMGVWDKVEQAGFPIKIGASYTWGASNDRWDFDFFPVEQWKDEPRPARYEGQRTYTAFQVDRAEYDTILLRHAEEMGVEVREETKVAEISVDGPEANGDGRCAKRVTGVVTDTGERITARYYIDASGVVGLIRRALGVETQVNERLRNIAVWDYWRNAEWAVEIGVGTTRVQVRSLPYGWIWFIPLGPDRTSIGLITPTDHYKKTGLSPEELYRQAIEEQPEIAGLTKNAEPEGQLQSCKDWSHLANQLAGDNWFICGEAAGFADPILAAGMSLAHGSARETAYAILELERGELDAEWVRDRYDHRNRQNIGQHIRFAEFWYAANGCFSDIAEHCQNIAKDSGLKLSPREAWRWLSQGGFTTEQIGFATFGSFDIASAKHVIEQFDPDGRSCEMLVDNYNVFNLNLRGAEKAKLGSLEEGRIKQIDCYRRGTATLPLTGYYGVVFSALERSSHIEEIVKLLKQWISQHYPPDKHYTAFNACIQALEVMCQEHWVLRKVNKKKPMLRVSNKESKFIRSSKDADQSIATAGATFKSNI